MLYDVDVHIPQLVEYLIKDFRDGDIDKLKASRIVVSKINPSLKANFDTTQVIFEEKQKNLYEKAFKKLRESIKEEDKLEVFVSIERVKVKLLKDLEELDEDRWETMIADLIRHIKTSKGKHG